MPRIWTIGHSTRAFADLVELLHQNEVDTIADVRRYPKSGRHPHFSDVSMQNHLPHASISYLHLPELGGRREARGDSPNLAWRNESFRGYADHMATEEFRGGIDRIIALAGNIAIMCAEAVPWRCHRNLISDELNRRGVEVVHILARDSIKVHAMNADAVDRGTHLIYPAKGPQRRLVFGSTGEQSV